MTKIAIPGAAGRMGKMLIQCVQRLEGLQVVAATEREDSALLGQDAGVVAGLPALGVEISKDPAVLGQADVIVDFTFHTAVPTHAKVAAETGTALIVGTTALSEEELAGVNAAAEVVPVLRAPNMSFGMNVLFALVESAARTLGLDYDIEVVETHHRYKQDAPSGTALHLAGAAATGREQDLDDVVVHGREGLVGERPRGEIGMHAIRSGDTVGDHTVSFGTDGERLELSHRATSREAFAFGALRAAAWLSGREAGLYSIRDVLGL